MREKDLEAGDGVWPLEAGQASQVDMDKQARRQSRRDSMATSIKQNRMSQDSHPTVSSERTSDLSTILASCGCLHSKELQLLPFMQRQISLSKPSKGNTPFDHTNNRVLYYRTHGPDCQLHNYLYSH